MNNFLNNLVEVSGNEHATSVDGGLVSDIKGFISTGSYTLIKVFPYHTLCRLLILVYSRHFLMRTSIASNLFNTSVWSSVEADFVFRISFSTRSVS